MGPILLDHRLFENWEKASDAPCKMLPLAFCPAGDENPEPFRGSLIWAWAAYVQGRRACFSTEALGRPSRSRPPPASPQPCSESPRFSCR